LRALLKLKDEQQAALERDAYKERRREIPALRQRIEQLAKYVRHELNCQAVLPQDPRFKHLRGACTCGLTKLLHG